jgi:alginate O-acetyltransferase complex protein AlgJ
MTWHLASFKPLPRRTMLAGLGAGALLAAARPARSAVVNLCVVGKNGWLFPMWDDLRNSNPIVIAKVIKTINTAVETFHDGKIIIALSLTPAKSRVYREFLPDDVQMTPASEHRYVSAYDALRKSGAVIFDQAAFFAAVRKVQPDTDLFFKADTHWKAVAAASAAAEMARQITLKQLLPPSTRPGLMLGDPHPVVQERNDLAGLLPASEQAKYPFETYYRREPVAGGQASLLEDDVSDTVVIGNSFMQPAYGYAATLSSELNRPVDLVWKVHQYSPYWTILSYLRSDAFKKQRPKLIVWNFEESDMETTADNSGAWGPNAMSPTSFLSDLRQLVAG